MCRILLFVFLYSLVACSPVNLKRAEDIVVLPNLGKRSSGVEGGSSLSYVSEEDVEEFGPISVLMSDKVLTMPVFIRLMADYDETYTKPVQYGLIIKSDRVCKAYLDHILDLRTGAKISKQLLEPLPGVVAAYTSPGSNAVRVAGQISATLSGVETALSGIGLEEEYIKNTIRRIVSLRNKMKDALLMAIEDEASGYNPHSFYMDIETYHHACSVYDRILYDEAEGDMLKELFAYRMIDDDATRRALLEK